MAPARLLKPLRKLHLYFGVFITPALLFFALSGALQTFDLHERTRDNPGYRPAHWMEVLGQIHKKQMSRLSPDPAPAAPKPARPQPDPTRVLTPPPPPPAARTRPIWLDHRLPLRLFFETVCLGLVSAALTGLYMAYKYNRSKLLIHLTLASGVILPLLLLLI